MAKLSWNETRIRAIQFSREWEAATHEQRDKQTFWNEFFDCFGIPRKSVAVFEHAVAKLRGSYHFLDLFWPGVLLVEHKSAGASLAKAESQAFSYMEELTRSEKGHDDLPRYVVLCDFAQFVLYDLEPDDQQGLPLLGEGRPFKMIEFPLRDLHLHVREFAFLKGETSVRLDPEDPANLQATQLLADLHDALESTGFTGHSLERLLVRLLFCMFAEDSGIFDIPRCFTVLIERTRQDGSDLGLYLAQLFQILNTPPNQRQSTLDEDLASFPYVNGGLFEEMLPIATFTSAHREALLACCKFHWERISPAVFGSLFQDILDQTKRRQLGAHYTSERDILKLLRSLFLDELRETLDAILADRSTRRIERLREFQKRLRALRFFDPACGCGNFLILAYREVRRLENETVIALQTVKGKIQQELDIRNLVQVDVDQFYGLEIGEWPVRIAEVGLWLTDHQCNLELAEKLGQSFRRLPLKATPTLRVANALRTNWREFLPPDDNVLILGNPPFVGKNLMNIEQKEDMAAVCSEIKGNGILDYVTAWYIKAADYIQQTHIRCAFVSTNSITQGEQVGTLWSYLFARYGIKLHFGHRTFSWTSEAKGGAHVHVVIIGFGTYEHHSKKIYDYDDKGNQATVTEVRNISPYLVDGPDLAVTSRTKPICNVPCIVFGSMPNDGGHLLLQAQEKNQLLATEPGAAEFLRRFVGSEEFLNGIERWCLWLVNVPPDELRALPEVRKRVERVRAHREASTRLETRKLAAYPTIFGEIRQPDSSYILIPGVCSERRRYIPIGLISSKVIASNLVNIILSANYYHFGILTSAIHMAWVRVVCGRLKSDYRYSNKVVYNNFPWPAEVSDKNRLDVETAAQAVLDVRACFPNATLADLYDPLAMPPTLVKAHATLDRAVDRCYQREPFLSDRARVEHLFMLYERFTRPKSDFHPK